MEKGKAGAEHPSNPAERIEEGNIRAAARGMPGKRADLPPGTLPKQNTDVQGDQNKDPIVQPGRGSPRDA